MRLHIFNPEHDIALAHDNPYLTPPRAGRALRRDLGELPLLWLENDDVVVVDDVAHAQRQLADVRQQLADRPSPLSQAQPSATDNEGGQRFLQLLAEREGHLCTLGDLRKLPITEVCPWGWDSALVHRLEKAGVSRTLMPTDGQLRHIRQLSSREFAASILPELTAATPVLIGKMQIAHSIDHIENLVASSPCVLKEPWSSSGRGVKFIAEKLTTAERNWAMNTLQRQGRLMVEPLYDKVADLGMEFVADAEGVHYVGLSLFHTQRSAYTGNIVASEAEKQSLLESIIGQETPIDEPLLREVRESICHLLSPHLRGVYVGPLGVDMMVVRADGELRLHPMVEINLRRTMGHVAISLYECGHHGQMAITYRNGRYILALSK